MVVAEYLPRPAQRVLRDAGCSFVDRAGHCYLHPLVGRPAPPPLPADLAGAAATAALSSRVAAGDPDWADYLLDPAAGPGGRRLLRHPIELLEWLVTVGRAKEMHPGASAYLYASDPDDILATLPHHLLPTPKDTPSRPLERPGVSLVGCGVLCFPSEDPGARPDAVLVGGSLTAEL